MERMKEYANRSGNSGVTHYCLLDDGSMTVIFKDGSIYIYPEVINQKHILNMLTCARAGRGLATYISTQKPLGARAGRVFNISNGKAT